MGKHSEIGKRAKGEKAPTNLAEHLVALTRWAEELGRKLEVMNQAFRGKEMTHDDGMTSMKRVKKERIPVMLGETVENPLGQRWTRVWCPFCVRYHYHGGYEGVVKSLRMGHRQAHCSEEWSPLRDRGYYIRLAHKRVVKIS
jgi:hypothetical protein